MSFFKPVIDFVTGGSPRPILRLTAYYVVLGTSVFLISYVTPLEKVLAPAADASVLNETSATESSQILLDGLTGATGASTTPGTTTAGENAAQDVKAATGDTESPTSIRLAAAGTFFVSTTILFLATLLLMLPVTWVYMSDRRKSRAFDQSMVETLIILPIVVAGTVLVVRNSLALAFSLAGVVAAVRFRTSLSDTRDVVFIFLAIAVGFAAGVETLILAAVVSIVFNYVLLLSWRFDFGRNALQANTSNTEQLKGPLEELAATDSDGKEIPDRELVLALTPTKVDVLAKKFNRIKAILGDDGEKPRYDAIVSVTSKKIGEAQKILEKVLDTHTKRWKLDEVISQKDRPSEVFYLARIKKSSSRDQLLTNLRAEANGTIDSAECEVGDALSVESAQIRDARKKQAKQDKVA
jgi:hypothetical protein